MSKNKKSINSLHNDLSENELRLSDGELNKTPQLLRDVILHHKNKSNCENCNWTILVLGFLDLQEAKNYDSKNCLLRISLELLFLKSEIITELVNKYGFKEDTGFRPELLDGEGIILVYCDKTR